MSRKRIAAATVLAAGLSARTATATGWSTRSRPPLEELGHEEDLGDVALGDACPPGAFKAGAWVHEVTVESSAEAGVEFVEIMVVN